MRLLYVIGIPGAGKSTVIRQALTGLARWQIDGTVPHLIYDRSSESEGEYPLAQLGRERGSFSGTDALAMSIQPKVISWLENRPYPNIVAEGDRLGNDKFFGEVKELGIELTVAYIHVPGDYAAQRRFERGSQQDERWLKGRASKVANLHEKWVDKNWILDGTKTPEELAARLRTHPAISPLFQEAVT